MTLDDSGPTVPDDAVASLLRDLTDIRETMPRCGTCGNFTAVVARVRDDLEGVATPAAGAAREQLGIWLAEAEGRVKTTNHCEVCVPSGPYERFAAALARAREGRGPA
jgi:hypothetical protein